MVMIKAEPVNINIYRKLYQIVCSKCGSIVSMTRHPEGYEVLVCDCLKPIREDVGRIPEFWNIEKVHTKTWCSICKKEGHVAEDHIDFPDFYRKKE